MLTWKIHMEKFINNTVTHMKINQNFPKFQQFFNKKNTKDREKWLIACWLLSKEKVKYIRNKKCKYDLLLLEREGRLTNDPYLKIISKHKQSLNYPSQKYNSNYFHIIQHITKTNIEKLFVVWYVFVLKTLVQQLC